jgi:hypothetical protein
LANNKDTSRIAQCLRHTFSIPNASASVMPLRSIFIVLCLPTSPITKTLDRHYVEQTEYRRDKASGSRSNHLFASMHTGDFGIFTIMRQTTLRQSASGARPPAAFIASIQLKEY